MALVGTLLPYLNRQFTDADRVPLPGAKITSLKTGTATPKDLFADAQLTTPLSNPAITDGDGRLTAFMEAGGYDFKVTDSNDTFLYTVSAVEDSALTFLSSLGLNLATGSVNVTSGYTILDTDTFVTVASTGGADPCVINLQPAADRPLPLGIKNLGTVALSITPDGADTIDSVAGVFTVAAAASPIFPSVWLVSDGISSYWILASHGL